MAAEWPTCPHCGEKARQVITFPESCGGSPPYKAVCPNGHDWNVDEHPMLRRD